MTTTTTNERNLTMTDNPTDERPQVKPFAAIVREARKGAMHDELSEQFADLVARCMETGKNGKLALTITIAPNDDGETLQITDDIKVTAPKFAAKPTLFYADQHGNVSRTNPRQPELPLRGVKGGKDDALTDVDAETGEVHEAVNA